MSATRAVTDARAALARQLASLRQATGLNQAHARKRLGYSRSAVARAETTGICGRDFCRLADQLYRAGDRLALAHDRIEALADTVRSQAARQARQHATPLSQCHRLTKAPPPSPTWTPPAPTAPSR